MEHLVNKLKFDVVCPDEEMAFGIRQNFAQTFQLQIAEVIEKVGNKYTSLNEYIRIDKLEVDMGALSQYNLDHDFEKLFFYQFEKEIKQKLSALHPEERKLSTQRSAVELVTYFLKNGLLPWWADEATTDFNEICEQVFSHSPEQLKKYLLAEKTNKNLWLRISFQLNKKLKQIIVDQLYPLSEAVVIMNEMAEKLISEIKLTNDVLSETIAIQLEAQVAQINDIVIANAPGLFTIAGNTVEIKNVFINELKHIFSLLPVQMELINLALSKVQNDFKKTPVIISGDKKKSTSFQQEEAQPEKTNDDDPGIEKIVVRHAGIILIAPFFKPFFTKLGLLKENKWVSGEAQVKAVYLLKYLSNGLQPVFEYELVLEKLLCGIPLSQPLPASPELAVEDTEEATSLLLSVIEHWKILKNTSIEGLRESFLKRDGIITAKEHHWLLQIERKTMDVLLDSIPWGIATISLAWNDYIIYTEW